MDSCYINKCSSQKGIKQAASQGSARPFRSISKSGGKYSFRKILAIGAYDTGNKPMDLVGMIERSC
jgi:hypothetical protein